MDPRFYKLFGYTLQAPAETSGGGGDADDLEKELENGDEEEESEEDDDPEDDDEEDDPDDDDDDEEDDEEDEESEEEEESEDDVLSKKDLENLSQRTQKRIKELNGENKDLKRQLEDAQKLGGKDGEAIISAATQAGIMPSLMTKDLAEGLSDLADMKNALAYFQNLLDGDDDEFELGGKTYSRRQIERKERTLTDKIRTAEAKLGPGRDKAIADAKELFELGLAAKKAGWKPGKSVKTKKSKTHDGPTHHAKAHHKKAAGRSAIKPEDVATDDDLEAFIASERRKKGK